MSVEIWPHVAPDQLKAAVETAEIRELDWFVKELHETFTNLKHGLEDCYALLAPIDPGSTLVLSTPRNEIVKGHVTRVGTRIVKGTIHLRLRTLPHQTLNINPDHPIHLASLTTLHALLTHSIDLLALTMSYSYPSATTTSPTATPRPPSLPPPQFLSAQLRLLSQSLAEASALLKGPPLTSSDPSWTTRSAPPSHFTPPLPQLHPSTTSNTSTGSSSSTPAGAPSLSFHLTIQDSSLVLWLRTLEPADAPAPLYTKLALAIGTARRLEHDEADKVFAWSCCNDNHNNNNNSNNNSNNNQQSSESLSRHYSASVVQEAAKPTAPIPLSGTRIKKRAVDVYVREKVRVESADPSLLSLSAKLTALGHTLALARRNLAAVMGEEVEGDE
ncbi:hypothetical protein N657DRAFT_643538 [Parathielavia appendiculata]|uniref:37S ribosomal protein rsm22 n=1 Tax=Parathielavia appendiculata TaxID=2587402 RepID=A0AAN6U471_9PEZI|nr:hypothetical protein N657DRAFT_643538 [Parathielavia appendiculata]